MWGLLEMTQPITHHATIPYENHIPIRDISVIWHFRRQFTVYVLVEVSLPILGLLNSSS